MLGLPAVLGKEAVMQIRTAVVVCIGAIVTDRAPEQLAAFPLHPFSCHQREPLAFGSASATMLTGAPGIDLNGDNPVSVCLVLRILVDLAA